MVYSIHSQLAALPAIKEIFERSESGKGQENLEHSVKWPCLLLKYTNFHSLFHLFQSSDQRHPCAKQPIIRAKHIKFLEFRTSEIASASLLGTIEQPLVRWSARPVPPPMCQILSSIIACVSVLDQMSICSSFLPVRQQPST